MNETGSSAPSYRALNFLVRHGDWVAALAGIVPAALGLAAWATGMPAAYGVAGMVGGAFLYLLMRSYVELVRVIVDMLLPK
jgi:hypothetical protein